MDVSIEKHFFQKQIVSSAQAVLLFLSLWKSLLFQNISFLQGRTAVNHTLLRKGAYDERFTKNCGSWQKTVLRRGHWRQNLPSCQLTISASWDLHFLRIIRSSSPNTESLTSKITICIPTSWVSLGWILPEQILPMTLPGNSFSLNGQICSRHSRYRNWNHYAKKMRCLKIWKLP